MYVLFEILELFEYFAINYSIFELQLFLLESETLIAISYHCMVKYKDDAVMMIGGMQNGFFTPSSLIVNPFNVTELTKGPSLNYQRYHPTCATIKDEFGNVNVIVAGGLDGNGYEMDSVEFLDTTTMSKWVLGNLSCFCFLKA